MARIRTIKPSFWASEKLGRMSVLARLNFVGLISLADDEGRGRGEKRYLLGQLHPYDESITEAKFSSAISELEKGKLVAFYSVDSARYYSLPGWRAHQYIEKAKRSELPPVPDAHPLRPLFVPSPSPTASPPHPGRNGMEGNGKEGITSAPSAVDFSEHRLQFRGKDDHYRGVYVINVPADEAEFLLSHARINDTDRAALKWRIAQKRGDMTKTQRKAQGVA